MAPLAALLALLAAARSAAEEGGGGERPPAPACPWEGAAAEDAAAEDAAGARLLQQAAQLQGPPSALEVASGASERPRAGSDRPGSVGLHYMMELQPAGLGATRDVTDLVESVLKLDTCFAEILVTLDYGVIRGGDDYHARLKIPGAALGFLNQTAGVAGFFCEVKQQTRRVAEQLERKCGGSVSSAVHVLDPALPRVKHALHQIFGNRKLPHRMFKNTMAYLYGPAVMKSSYIVHVDDDVWVTPAGPLGTFAEQAMQVMEHSTLAGVNMPCCTCGESQRMIEFDDSRSLKFSGLAVGHTHWVSPNPDNMWKVRGLDNAVCADVQNFFTMQAYAFHTKRVRAMFPLRIEGGAEPAAMHIECLLSEAAKMTNPPTIFGMIGEGVSQCRDLRNPTNQGPLMQLHHNAELTRCERDAHTEVYEDL